MHGAVLKKALTGVRTEKHPHVHLVVGKLKLGRHDADDRVITVIELDALAVHRLIRKVALPESMTNNRHSIGPRLLLFR